MIEPILKALVQLFALISDVGEISPGGRAIVKLFLTRQLNNELVDRYMQLFDEYILLYRNTDVERGSVKERKRTSLTAVRILGICEQINSELQQKQKLFVFTQLLDFILFGAGISDTEIEFIETVAFAFNIPETEFRNIKSFVLGSAEDVPEKKRVMIIDNRKDADYPGFKHLTRESIGVKIFLLHIVSTNSFLLRYEGREDIFLNGQNCFPGQTYAFDHGSTLRCATVTIYYNMVSNVFSSETFRLKVTLHADNVNLKFRNSDAGLHDFNFHEESGNLVGVLGGSGVGKTTLLNVLSGMTRPQEGRITVNGYDIYHDEEKVRIQGVTGFVPQDDLLIEELTVYQNLYYSAKMCLDNLSEMKLRELIDSILIDLDLDETRNLRVGNSLNKVISGGQRKRLNIALELIREPTILFVDEPTSGLASVDSETVMTLLKEQADRGKLVIVNIHQPGSDIYKMFDKVMLIDKGGYQIFYGNPSEAIVYFKTQASYANAENDQCVTCGNIDSDELLHIIEAKAVDEQGKLTHIRKVAPREWFSKFRDLYQANLSNDNNEKQELPENFYAIPGIFKQSKIYFTRDLLSKLANRQYVLISLFGAPVLALLLSYFTRYSIDGEYIFRKNENLPSYLFMCVITSLFLGLIISAEEIIRDRKILKRESFLNLSWFSYLNSKMGMMFMISAIQTISFILIGNLILGIKGMTLTYWIILFTTSCLANMIGLNISSAFSSVITIYILIPFIIIPQLLFSGVIVKFDNLHNNSSSPVEFVPVIGEMMPTRWSFEALATEQFKHNRYERSFFKKDVTISDAGWNAFVLIKKLKEYLRINKFNKNEPDHYQMVAGNLVRLNYHLGIMSSELGMKKPVALTSQKLDSASIAEANKALDTLSARYIKIYKKNIILKDTITRTLERKYGTQAFIAFKDNYFNEKLGEVVLDAFQIAQYAEMPNRIIRKSEPGYMIPYSKYGRARFYSPYKLLGNTFIDTFLFNVAVLWLVSLLLYIALYYKVLQRMLTLFENRRH